MGHFLVDIHLLIDLVFLLTLSQPDNCDSRGKIGTWCIRFLFMNYARALKGMERYINLKNSHLKILILYSVLSNS